MLRRPSQDELSSLERLPGIPEIVLSADTARRARGHGAKPRDAALLRRLRPSRGASSATSRAALTCWHGARHVSTVCQITNASSKVSSRIAGGPATAAIAFEELVCERSRRRAQPPAPV